MSTLPKFCNFAFKADVFTTAAFKPPAIKAYFGYLLGYFFVNDIRIDTVVHLKLSESENYSGN